MFFVRTTTSLSIQPKNWRWWSATKKAARSADTSSSANANCTSNPPRYWRHTGSVCRRWFTITGANTTRTELTHETERKAFTSGAIRLWMRLSLLRNASTGMAARNAFRKRRQQSVTQRRKCSSTISVPSVITSGASMKSGGRS